MATTTAVGPAADRIAWQGDGHVPYAQHCDEIVDLTTGFVYRMLDAGSAAR